MQRIRLTVDSELRNVRLLRAALRGLCEHASMRSEDVALLELCLAEATANVIEHAYRLRPGLPVELDVVLEGDGVALEIRDRGPEVPDDVLRRADPARNPDDDAPPELDEGGRGLFLMATCLDGVEYRRVDGTNVLVLRKRRTPDPVDATAR